MQIVSSRLVDLCSLFLLWVKWPADFGRSKKLSIGTISEKEVCETARRLSQHHFSIPVYFGGVHFFVFFLLLFCVCVCVCPVSHVLFLPRPLSFSLSLYRCIAYAREVMNMVDHERHCYVDST